MLTWLGVQVTALRAQADMLGLENEKLQLAEAVEAQRERNRQLQVRKQRVGVWEGLEGGARGES